METLHNQELVATILEDNVTSDCLLYTTDAADESTAV